ncbi:MAG TPA: hypothetical protein VIS06_11185 [Mycobacteriales bacterium]
MPDSGGLDGGSGESTTVEAHGRMTIDEDAARWLEPVPVVLPEIPRVYGLYRREDAERVGRPEAGLVAWVIALPGGTTAVLRQSESGRRIISFCPGVEHAMRRWGALNDADLVALAEPV